MLWPAVIFLTPLSEELLYYFSIGKEVKAKSWHFPRSTYSLTSDALSPKRLRTIFLEISEIFLQKYSPFCQTQEFKAQLTLVLPSASNCLPSRPLNILIHVINFQ